MNKEREVNKKGGTAINRNLTKKEGKEERNERKAREQLKREAEPKFERRKKGKQKRREKNRTRKTKN